MTGPIRQLLAAAQATKDVLPATMFQFYVESSQDVTWEDDFARELIPVHNGTPEGDTLTALNGKMTKLTYTSPLFYDQTARLWTAVSGLPGTETPVVGDTTVIDHISKRITVSDPPLWAFQYWDNITGNWRQMLNGVLDSVEITIDENKAPKAKWTFMGNASVVIATPTIPAIVSAYNPLGYRHLTATIGGAAAGVMKGTLKLNNSRKARYYGNAGANVGRYTRGLAKTDLDLTVDIVTYTGSEKEEWDNETNMGHLILVFSDTGVNIGTLPHHPTLTLDIEKVRMSKLDLQTVNDEKAEVINITAGYGTTNATGLLTTWRNLDAVGAYVGS